MAKDNICCELKGSDGKIYVTRNADGTTEITAESYRDAVMGIGWAHACDRQLQIMLTRAILEGRSSEKIADRKELVEADMYIRSLNLYPDIEEQKNRLEPAVMDELVHYAAGINAYLSSFKPAFEFRLLGYRPEPWKIEDSMMLAKTFTYFGLSDAQGNMEKLIVQMVQNGLDSRRLRELFPYLTENIDEDLLKKVRLEPPLVPAAVRWLARVPRFIGSNNWAVSGKHTSSKSPILCGDPHLEVNRMPGVWYETVIRLPNDTIAGFGVPGTPSLLVGRNSHIAFSPTYSFMDMIDYRIEECADHMYRRGNWWIPFKVRTETIKTKKGREIKLNVYENEHGVLEGDPSVEGFYLVRAWSAAKDCGAQELNVTSNVLKSRSVREAMKHYRNLDSASFNFVIADTAGNIGYQMSGRLFNRPAGVSGLLPLPGWERKYNNRGYVARNRLPSCFNPAAGYIVTANQDLNHMGSSRPINLPMAGYRAERIEQLLKERKSVDVEYMKEIQYDLYSLQAERILKIIFPFIPDTGEGRVLRQWDCRYIPGSRGAALFENVYKSILHTVFGDNGLGKEVVDYLLGETGIFNDYFGNFDRVIMNRRSEWYRPSSRDDILKAAVDRGLSEPVTAYMKSRSIYFRHLLFGDLVPPLFGFDTGPWALPGGRATIVQGQIFRSAGRDTTFCPSCRIITDMDGTFLLTNSPGGQSDRRFSKWYNNNTEGWLSGIYRRISL